MTVPQLFEVLDQYTALLRIWNIPRHRARINFSGGEPLLRKDLFEFLEEVSERSNHYRSYYRRVQKLNA